MCRPGVRQTPDAAGRIQLRLYDALYGPSADPDRLLAAGPDPQHCGGKLAMCGIELYIDGALGSRGAAPLKPYSDSPGPADSGDPRVEFCRCGRTQPFECLSHGDQTPHWWKSLT